MARTGYQRVSVYEPNDSQIDRTPHRIVHIVLLCLLTAACVITMFVRLSAMSESALELPHHPHIINPRHTASSGFLAESDSATTPASLSPSPSIIITPAIPIMTTPRALSSLPHVPSPAVTPSKTTPSPVPSPPITSPLPPPQAVNSYGDDPEACAVIFSSGVLRKYRYGPEIDTFRKIMRLNIPPVTGFEEFVGSRTTFQLINPGVLVYEQRLVPFLEHASEKDRDIKIFSAWPQPNTASNFTELFQDPVHNPMGIHGEMLPNRGKSKCTEMFYGSKPAMQCEVSPCICSTGAAAIYHALRSYKFSCSHVFVYGVRDEPCLPIVYHHPWPNNCDPDAVPISHTYKHYHDWELEHTRLYEMAAQGLLTIVV